MQISDEQLEKFREIYRREYGKDISKEDAYESALMLIRLVWLVYKKMPSQNNSEKE